MTYDQLDLQAGLEIVAEVLYGLSMIPALFKKGSPNVCTGRMALACVLAGAVLRLDLLAGNQACKAGL